MSTRTAAALLAAVLGITGCASSGTGRDAPNLSPTSSTTTSTQPFSDMLERLLLPDSCQPTASTVVSGAAAVRALLSPEPQSSTTRPCPMATQKEP